MAFLFFFALAFTILWGLKVAQYLALGCDYSELTEESAKTMQFFVVYGDWIVAGLWTLFYALA